MFAAFHLVPGAKCIVDNAVVEIDRLESASRLAVRNLATGHVHVVPVSRVKPLPRTERRSEDSLESYDPQAWTRAKGLAAEFSPLVEQRLVPIATMRRIALKHGLSVRQVQRLRRRFQSCRAVSELCPVPRGRARRQSRLRKEVREVIAHAIRKYYLRRERPTVTEVVLRAQSLCRRLGLPEPKRGAVVQRIQEIPKSEQARLRLGTRAAKQLHEPRTGKLSVTQPLERVQIDHTRVDVMVVAEDRKTVLGRPWITLAIDVASRCVVGMYLTMDAPSSVSVSLCIDHLVLPKMENDEPGCEDIWPMYGKPKCIHVDNGKDFQAEALRRGCAEHDIALEFRPVRTPHYGAHIERLNGTLMKLCHLIPGTTFSSVKERGDYDSEGRALFTLDELRRWLVQQICRRYHVRRHRSLGVPPRVAWEKLWTDAEGRVSHPPLVADPFQFRLDFLPSVLRLVTRSGIALACSTYYHPQLREMCGVGQTIVVKYDPRARGCVYVRLPDRPWLEVPAVSGPAAGQPQHRFTMDAETAARMDGELDRGFDTVDDIERKARSLQRAVRHGLRKGQVAAAAPPALAESTTAVLIPAPTLSAAPLMIEVW